jgi:Transport protein Avl9
MTQFALISLIPGLIRNLQDCADPELNNYEHNLVKPTTLKTSERTSCRQRLTMKTIRKLRSFS